MKVLFIGGTGIISSACSALALERGIELYLLNRGTSQRATPAGAQILRGDIRNRDDAKRALAGQTFDAVVDWLVFTPEQAQTDLELFRDCTAQYIFISSASVYQKPVAHLPITESTPLSNPFWVYSQNKIACEDVFTRAYRDTQFPVTIVRPSHTYDQTLLPFRGGFTMVKRMRENKPVIVHGDGTSLWTMTNHRDFAKGFVGLLGNPAAIGDTFQITSDEWLTWNQIYEIIARAAGVTTPRLTHIASDFIAAFDADWGAGLLGDKSHSAIFDNTKIKRLVPDFVATIPFAQGAREIMRYYDADPSRQVSDEKFNQLLDRIIAAHTSALPKTN